MIDQNHRSFLQNIVHRAMLERGLLPDFSAAAIDEMGRMQSPTLRIGAAAGTEIPVRDMRDFSWASISARW